MKHKIEFADHLDFYEKIVKIDGTWYSLDYTSKDEDEDEYIREFTNVRSRKRFKFEDFITLLIECGYMYQDREVYNEWEDCYDLYPSFIKIKTIPEVQGVYKDPKGNEWYSAWNETHPEATK